MGSGLKFDKLTRTENLNESEIANHVSACVANVGTLKGVGDYSRDSGKYRKDMVVKKYDGANRKRTAVPFRVKRVLRSLGDGALSVN